MATLPTRPFRMAPLQRLMVKPIVDPAQQAALEERLQRAEVVIPHDATPPPTKEPSKTPTQSTTESRKRRSAITKDAQCPDSDEAV
jgi:hypothetical protein